MCRATRSYFNSPNQPISYLAHSNLIPVGTIADRLVAGWQQLRMLDDRTRTSHELAFTAERAAVDVARIVAEAEHDRSELVQLDANMALEQKLVGDQLASADRLKSMEHRTKKPSFPHTFKVR
jgi:hypothetical protein